MENESIKFIWKYYEILHGKSNIDERIRRVSIDRFYYMVTGEINAFKNLCDVLPDKIDENSAIILA